MTDADQSMSNQQAPIVRVLVISAVRLYREGLADVLRKTNGMTVIGALPASREICARVAALAPDVVVLDVMLPESHASIHSISESKPGTPIVAIGIGDSEAEIIACAEARVAGYLTHDASIADLVAVIKAASRGEVTCSPQVAAAFIRRLATLASTARTEVLQPALTRREREIAGYLERDLTNKEIASRLGIEVATVKNHVHNLLEKLSVHRRGEAARVLGTTRRRA